MLSLKFLSLASRSYYILFFRVIFLHFKFVVFFTFFSLSTNFLKEFKSLVFNYYCGLSFVSSKIIAAVFSSKLSLNLFFSKIGLLFSNHLPILFDFIFFLAEKFNNITFLSFLFLGNFLNFFVLDLISFSRLFLLKSRFRFFFQPFLYICLLYRVKKILS